MSDEKIPMSGMGKTLSLWSKIIAVVVVISFNIAKLILSGNIMPLQEQKSIIVAAAFVMMAFSPVDISIIINNILGRK